MPAQFASAPGKIILFGEHAAVYGRPALAVPVTQISAKAYTLANPLGAPDEVLIEAPAIGLISPLSGLPSDHPLVIPILAVKNLLHCASLPSFRLRITSTIPIASGLGSGAAVSVAIARAVSSFLGHPLADEQISEIAFLTDQKYHGNPSGIDNTVITYARPIYFIRGKPFESLNVHQPFTIVIGNTGISSPTSAVVGDVRRRWLADPAHYDQIFDSMAELAQQARSIITTADPAALGPLMTANHTLLRQLDVSSPELDRLVSAALDAGALGAKLCGAGRGGNMLALVSPSDASGVAAALSAHHALNTITTIVR